MTDIAASAQSAQDAWAEAAYTSAIPDFKGSPEIMFHSAAGWGYPDPAWQAGHRGWEPERNAKPVAGVPVHLSHWSFWVPKGEIKREARKLRIRRVGRYAFYAALYPVAFAVIVSSLLSFLFLPAGLLAVLLGSPIALAGSIALFITLSLILAMMDFIYLGALRRGVRGSALFHWTFAPALGLDVVLTLALSLITYSLITLDPDGKALGVFSAAAAMGSLSATVPLLVAYALKELRLKES